MLEERAPFTKNRNHVHRPGRPVPGHEPRQRGVAIRHLDRKRQIPNVFEESQEDRDVVVPEIPLAEDPIQHVQPAGH